MENLSVSFDINNMESEIYHWHEEIFEILLVLQGKAIVEIIGEQYPATENEMIFINKWMPHKVIACDSSTVFVEIHFKLHFWENYVKNTSKVFFVRNPNILNNDSGLTRIRNLLARIYRSHTQKSEEASKQLIENGKMLFSILYKEFNYIQKSPDSYRNAEQFERVWAVFRYMQDNHAQKITLSSMAQYVHVSESHLSHSIKVESGRSFEEWLNMYRAENAARLLVSGNMSLTKISYACGFSDPRYLNSCFKKHFRCLPSEYRAQNKKIANTKKDAPRDDDYMRIVQQIMDEKMRAFLVGRTNLMPDDSKKNSKSIELKINCQEKTTAFRHGWRDCLDVGQAENLRRAGYQKFLKEIQNEIRFKYIKIKYPFDGTEIITREGSLFADWESLFELFDFILDIKARPFISLKSRRHTDDELERILDGFLRQAAILYGEEMLSTWRVGLEDSTENNNRFHLLLSQYGISIYPVENKKVEKNYLYDTAYMVPFFIRHALANSTSTGFNNLFDKNTDDFFTGEQGLITSGLKKPLYQAYVLLGHLGNQLISCEENYIITKKYDDLQILIWNYAASVDTLNKNDLNLALRDRYAVFATEKPLEATIQIAGLSNNQYILKQLYFDRDNGCLYDNLHDVKAIPHLSKNEKDRINTTSSMKSSYDYIYGKDKITLNCKIKENGACLLYLKKTKDSTIEL